MKNAVPFRVTVSKPLSCVVMQMQRGRDEFLPPTEVFEHFISFEFEITVDVLGEGLNFLGKYAQGPKDARFIYVNSGQQAGQVDTCWDRRAKLSLMSITIEQIEKVLSSPGSRIETTMDGIGRDGGPTCASVKGLVWKVGKK
ncbi:MAG TPA: DUF5990 family protein [Pyrinomonadaceae bacterium]|nr:DUF5990 family protein [Pyrinomonadaceae bacterium]